VRWKFRSPAGGARHLQGGGCQRQNAIRRKLGEPAQAELFDAH